MSATDTGEESAAAAIDDDTDTVAEDLNADVTVMATAHHTDTAETASPSEPAEIQPVQQATLNQRQKINRRKSVQCLPLRPAQRMKQPALKQHRFSAACAVF